MIRQLRTVLGAEHRGDYTRFLVWASLYGVLQAVAVSFLLPIAGALIAEDFGAIWGWLAVLAVVVLFTGIAHYVQAMRGFEVALVVLRTMHLNIGDHLVKLPLGWFAGRLGEVTQVAAKGTLAAGSAAAHLMTPVIIGVASPATIALIMLFFDWRLGLTLVLAAPVIALSARGAGILIARSEQKTHEAEVEVNDRVLEFARAQKVLRAFGVSKQGGYPPLTRAISAQQQMVRRSLFDAIFGVALNGVVLQLVFTALLVIAAILALGGTLSGITLLALLGVASRFIQLLADVGEFGGTLRLTKGELARIQAIMDTPELAEPEVSAPLSEAGLVEFDRVGFAYQEGIPVLEDVSFTVAPGTMTAIVGPSGSGKTTITRLIARFFEVQHGSVRVGGVDVHEQSTEQLMAQLALVFQDVYLFDDTLWGNIRIGRPNASDQEILEAARLAGVSEIADRLQDGWQTMVGEAGSALSGGERQRVSIARAILKRAPIVLLDEATAALDPENERYLQHTIDTLRTDTTLVIIAHRLSTVVNADNIIVLAEDGRIAETGTHLKLLAHEGRYAAFWQERHTAHGWKLNASR